MAKKGSSIADVLAALPAVQAAVREEIAARIAAGETIARIEGDRFVSTRLGNVDLPTRRKKLLDRSAEARGFERKSIA